MLREGDDGGVVRGGRVTMNVSLGTRDYMNVHGIQSEFSSQAK